MAGFAYNQILTPEACFFVFIRLKKHMVWL